MKFESLVLIYAGLGLFFAALSAQRFHGFLKVISFSLVCSFGWAEVVFHMAYEMHVLGPLFELGLLMATPITAIFCYLGAIMSRRWAGGQE